MNNSFPILNLTYVFFVLSLYCRPITHTIMKTKRIFASKSRFTRAFVSFLEDHHSLHDFLCRTGFDSIEEYCSYFYNQVSNKTLVFESAVFAAFPWPLTEFFRWYHLSEDWFKFVHSK